MMPNERLKWLLSLGASVFFTISLLMFYASCQRAKSLEMERGRLLGLKAEVNEVAGRQEMLNRYRTRWQTLLAETERLGLKSKGIGIYPVNINTRMNWQEAKKALFSISDKNYKSGSRLFNPEYFRLERQTGKQGESSSATPGGTSSAIEALGRAPADIAAEHYILVLKGELISLAGGKGDVD